MGASIHTAGKKKDDIPVKISLTIIKHFSDGLYSSPNKAIEELVVNSYDAGASVVQVLFPSSGMDAPGAHIAVADNGSGMDIKSFRDLWRIGKSNKEGKISVDGIPDRKMIGKFGIGKLAAYVIGKKLTHFSKMDGRYRLITMDFGHLEDEPDMESMALEAREVSESEAETLVGHIYSANSRKIDYFGDNSPSGWTIALIQDFRAMAFELREGRLSWVLRTALPLNPQFSLYINNRKLDSPKINQPKIATWTVGTEDDEDAYSKCGFEELPGHDETPGRRIPGIGHVTGEFELYENPLEGSKSDVTARSHGFFILVNGRVINLHDELFGIEALSHGAYSRFRFVINADGLNMHLRASRESVNEEAEGVKKLRKYLKFCFNEARKRFEGWVAKRDEEASLSIKLGKTPRSITRQPLVRAIKACLEDPNVTPSLIKLPPDIDDETKQQLITDLEDALDGEMFFQEVEFDLLGPDSGLAIFDASRRTFTVNIQHPFYANYQDHYKKGGEPFQLLAITEVLTEAFMIDANIQPSIVHDILRLRDRFLRELVWTSRLDAPLVAELLNDTRNDSAGLEKAVAEGLKALGFEVTPIGGSNQPDGTATARMGVRSDNGADETYTITYDAKSSSKKKIAAGTVKTATLVTHRERLNAQFSLVVAPGYEGSDAPDSHINEESLRDRVTCMTIDDFILLILISTESALGFSKIRDELLAKLYRPHDVHKWIEEIVAAPRSENPLADILSVAWDIQTESPDAPEFSSISERLRFTDHGKYSCFRKETVRDWIRSASIMTGGGLITVDGEKVHLELPPEDIITRIEGIRSQLPKSLLDKINSQ